MSLARTIQRPGLMMVWEMAAESLLSRQQSRYASVLVGGSTYRAQISARTVTDTSAIFIPKFIFDLQDPEDKQPSNLRASTVCALWFRNRRFQLWLWRIG